MLNINEPAQQLSQQTTKPTRLVCLFVLRFYGPVNPMGSCRARSVYLTTRLLGRLSSLSGKPVLCTFFRQKLTTAFLNQRKGENNHRKYFISISMKECCLPRPRLNPQPPGLKSDGHPTEPPRVATSTRLVQPVKTQISLHICTV